MLAFDMKDMQRRWWRLICFQQAGETTVANRFVGYDNGQSGDSETALGRLAEYDKIVTHQST